MDLNYDVLFDEQRSEGALYNPFKDDEGDPIDWDVTSGQNSERHISYIPAHLGSPLYDHESKFLEECSRPICKRHKKLKSFKKQHNYNLMSDYCKNYMNCLTDYIDGEVLFTNSKLPTDYSESLKQHLIAAVESTSIHKQHLLSHYENGDFTPRIQTYYLDKFSSQIPRLVTALFDDYIRMKKVEKIKDTICYKEIALGDLINHRDLYAERDIMMIKCPTHGKVCGSTNLLLCALDKAQAMFSVKLYWLLCDCMSKYTFSIYEYGTRLIKIFMDLRDTMGEDFFAFMNSWEPLVVGSVINDPSDLSPQQLFGVVSTEMITLLTKYDLPESIIQNIVPDQASPESYRMWLELVGISKLFGHPILKIEHLLDDLKKYGSQHGDPPDNGTIQMTVAITKRDFIVNYFEKNHHYPKILESTIDEKLLKYYRKNQLPDRRVSKDYEIWYRLKFQKTFEYDFSPDTSDLIKDSASSCHWSQWSKNYDPCAFSHLYGKAPPYVPPGGKSTRRIIERYLTGTPLEVFNIVQDTCNFRINPEFSTAEQCGKEGELKILNGRSFVKQTYEQRLLQVSMEMNISESLFKYVPEQSMTDPEIISTRRIMRNVTELRNGQSEKINLDLKKWNIRFRHALVYHFGEILDDLFDTPNLYKYNHLWFINSNIITNSRLHPPDYDADGNPIEGPYYYKNHFGGMEGMRQKLWTWITIGIIKYTAEKSNIQISLMGQGDNQVIIIHYNRNQLLIKDEVRIAFMNSLETIFWSVGLELKMSETWSSKYLHEYGKARYYDGIAVSQGTKKSASLVPDANESYPTFSSPISTINTLTESIAQKDSSATPAFIMNQFHTLNYLSRKNIKLGRTYKLDWLKYLMVPADFGGLSISCMFDHIIRGHNDKVTAWLSFYWFLIRNNNTLFNTIIKYCQFLPDSDKVTEKDQERLLQDIYCLNIQTLPTMEREIKELTMDYLKSKYVTNSEIKQLHENKHSIQRDFLIQHLLSLEPYYPPLAYTLYELSNEGILLALRNKMVSVSTVNRMVQRKTGNSFITLMTSKIEDYKVQLQKKFGATSRYDRNLLLFKKFQCPTTLAQHLRVQGWKLNIIGLTKPFPTHQVAIKSWDNLTSTERSKSISIQTTRLHRNHPNIVDYEIGSYDGYIGSVTREKVKKPSVDISSKTIWVKAIKQLGTLYSWMEKLNIPNLKKLIKMLIREKISVLPEEFSDENLTEWTAYIYGGNIFHRFFATVEKSSAIINYLPNTCTHFYQNTDSMSPCTAGGKDFTIFYQLIILTNTYVINKIGRILGSLPTDKFGSAFLCGECTLELEGASFDIRPIEKDVMLSDAPRHETFCPLLFKYNYYEIKDLITYHVGKIVGQNVDRNFNRIYKKFDTNLKTDDIVKAQVSINDVRLFDLKTFLITVFIHSDHLVSLYTAPVSYASFSTDKSCAHLAELILCSGFLEQVMAICPKIATEHKQLTCLNSFAPLLIRIIHHLVKTEQQLVFKTIAFVSLHSEDLSAKASLIAHIRKYATYELPKNKRIYSSITSILRNVTKLSVLNISRILVDAINCPLVSNHYDIDEETILFVWRSAPRSSLLPSRYQGTPALLPAAPETAYSLEKYFTIHRWRRMDNPEVNQVTRYRIPTLCHIARPMGNISSAASKYLEIILILKLDKILRGIKTGYFLAEGSGSTALCFYLRYPDLRIGYTTLLTSDVDFRFNFTFTAPPAVVNSGFFDQSRLVRDEELCAGETDILDDIYVEKLFTAFSVYPPGLLTIDAESPNEGTNIEFAQRYIPIICAYLIKVSILKMFYYTLLDADINRLLFSQLNGGLYDYYMIKPVSSSLTTREIFLVLILRETEDSPCLESHIHDQLVRHSSYYTYLNNPSPVDESTLFTYINTAKDVSIALQEASNHLDQRANFVITDKYCKDIEDLQACGYWCKRLVSYLLRVINDTHTNMYDQNIYPVVRMRGTDKTLTLMVKDVVFILTMIACEGDLFTVIKKLSFKDITDVKDLRKRFTDLIFDETAAARYFEDWCNAKMFFRRASTFSVCRCTGPFKLQSCRKNPEKNLVITQIFKEMSRLGLIEKSIKLRDFITREDPPRRREVDDIAALEDQLDLMAPIFQ
jgi:hypothetical protein